MTPDVLFNCCTHHAAPDWVQFDALEIGGCVNDAEEGEESTNIIGGIERDEAEFFCVYGHLKEGGCEAITDCETFEQAQAVAAQLSALSGLPVNIHC